MKHNLRLLFVVGLTVAMSLASVDGQEKKETLGDKLKKLFSHPTPTPTPRRTHHRRSPSPGASAPPVQTYGETPAPNAEPSASVETLSPVEAATPDWQNFEPVRAISPGPHSRTEIIHAPQTMPVATATPTPIAEIASEANAEERPTPSLPPVAESAPAPPSLPSAKVKSPPITVPEKESYSPEVGKIVDLAMDLKSQNLNYKYASADPAKGGLDCSGFIYYVLTRSGIRNVPRDAREQYVWVRKAGNFQAVLAHSDDTFELDGLKPGDLLFWAESSGVGREPEITQTMIYIGHDKSTKQRLMMGASERGTFEGKRKSGVGVFDFKLGSAGPKPDEESNSVFVGYGRIPNSSGN